MSLHKTGWRGFAAAAMLMAVSVAPAFAGPDCGETAAGFSDWLQDFRQEALETGIAPHTIDLALAEVSYDPTVISHDRHQGEFHGEFASFAAKRVTANRVKKGRQMLIAYAEAFDAIEQKYGVPGPVLVAIWGLETECGAGSGTYPTFNALATLAFDCRRSDQFREELMAALRFVQRGALDPARSRSAWAGEIGQTQFMPTVYLHYAVSIDGRRVADLVGNSEDALASTANFLKAHGWKRGQGWREGQPNFDALMQWNEAAVYAKTIALFADRLDAP